MSISDGSTTESTATVVSSVDSENSWSDFTDEPDIDSDAVVSETGVLGFPTTYLGNYTLIDQVFGTAVTVTVTDGIRIIDANALPNHETGEFPNSGNPNAISAQNASWSFPAEPTWTGTPTDVRITGVALNGVKFEPGTAETITCSSGEILRIEALQGLYNLGFDMNNAHVQPNGEYHYHGISPLLVEAFDDDKDLLLLGFAADGHLMVYSKSGSYKSGFSLITDPRTGSDCTPSLRGSETIDLDGTTPDGTYTSDWEYSSESGALDECNGIMIDGTYIYVVTDEYPFIPRCLFGEVNESEAPRMSAGAPGGPPARNRLLDLSTVAANLGVDVDDLRKALDPPPPDLEVAAAQLGVTVDELQEALGPPPR
jgi:hypothetical protein